jgi:HPt (histidine-containing phosphotransfer) domain-containing protein
MKINLTYLNEICGGDSEFIAEMLKTYIDETSNDMQLLEQALNSLDIKRIGFIAHKSKSAFKLLGIQKLAEVAEKTEKEAKSETATIELLQPGVHFILENVSISFDEASKLIKELRNTK